MKIRTGPPEIRIAEGSEYMVALVLFFDLEKDEKLPNLSELATSLVSQLEETPHFRLVAVPLSTPVETTVVESDGDKYLEHSVTWKERI